MKIVDKLSQDNVCKFLYTLLGYNVIFSLLLHAQGRESDLQAVIMLAAMVLMIWRVVYVVRTKRTVEELNEKHANMTSVVHAICFVVLIWMIGNRDGDWVLYGYLGFWMVLLPAAYIIGRVRRIRQNGDVRISEKNR